MQAMNAEAAVKQSMDALTQQQKAIERDLAVLMRLRSADAALADAMQPMNALQKAADQVDEAKRLGPDFYVRQGVIRVAGELEAALRSPASADFGRLRSLLRDQAVEPASRVAVRNAMQLEEQILAWLKVQELIATHLRTLSEITGESLRATQSER